LSGIKHFYNSFTLITSPKGTGILILEISLSTLKTKEAFSVSLIGGGGEYFLTSTALGASFLGFFLFSVIGTFMFLRFYCFYISKIAF